MSLDFSRTMEDNMAGSEVNERTFANVVSEPENMIPEGYGSAKPIFILEKDIFGLTQPQRKDWLTHQELYKSIGEKVEANHVCGLQRTGKMWRVYVDNMTDRTKLLTTGIVIRKKLAQLLSTNPRRPDNNPEYTSRIRVSNVPLSADDGQIKRALTMHKCVIKSMYREKLRVDNKLTNCDTGDRIVITDKLTTPLPRNMKIGRYNATVFHAEQPKSDTRPSISDPNNLNCKKCLQTGHVARDCTNSWVCRECHMPGHRMIDCPSLLQSTNSNTFPGNDEEVKSYPPGENGSRQDHTETDREGSVTDHDEDSSTCTDGNRDSDSSDDDAIKEDVTPSSACSKKKRKKRKAKRSKGKVNRFSLEEFMILSKDTPKNSNTNKKQSGRTPPTPLDGSPKKKTKLQVQVQVHRDNGNGTKHSPH